MVWRRTAARECSRLDCCAGRFATAGGAGGRGAKSGAVAGARATWPCTTRVGLTTSPTNARGSRRSRLRRCAASTRPAAATDIAATAAPFQVEYVGEGAATARMKAGSTRLVPKHRPNNVKSVKRASRLLRRGARARVPTSWRSGRSLACAASCGGGTAISSMRAYAVLARSTNSEASALGAIHTMLTPDRARTVATTSL